MTTSSSCGGNAPRRPTGRRRPASRPSATTAPLATVGGPVAIPTRASVAAMAAQAARPDGRGGGRAAAAQPRSRTKTSPRRPMRRSRDRGAVAEAVEGQPTIPLRALTERAAGSQPAVGPAARLVVLTTDWPGWRFALDKASLVIGRTEENDVLLNHRSISRHHAKIVRDGDHYTIVDLQSANGIRVNGEDYERIELNAGDVVELGHVKIRFVGPLESFVFDPARAPAAAAPWEGDRARRGRAGAHRAGCAVPSSIELERAAHR